MEFGSEDLNFGNKPRLEFLEPCRKVHAGVDHGQDEDNPIVKIADQVVFLDSVEIESRGEVRLQTKDLRPLTNPIEAGRNLIEIPAGDGPPPLLH